AAAVWSRRALRSSEHRTRQTEQRLSRLRALAPVGIADCGTDGRVHAVNPEWGRLTRRREQEWADRTWWDALSPAYRDRARTLWTRGADGPGATVMEARLERNARDESEIWVLVRFGVEDVVDGARKRAVTLTDISQ